MRGVYLILWIALAWNAPPSSQPSTTQLPPTTAEPHVAWPVQCIYQRLYPDRVVVLEPVFNKPAGARWELAVTYSGKELEALDAAGGRPVWPRSIACPAEPTLLRMDESRLVFITHYRVFALVRTSGAIAWQVGDELPDDPNIDPESVPWWTDRFMTAGRLYVVSSTGELMCIDPRDGSIRWRCDIGKDAYKGLIADDRYVYYAKPQVIGNILNVLDADSGVHVGAIPMNQKDRVAALRTISRGRVAVVIGRGILWIDLTKGELSGWVRSDGPVQLSALQSNAAGLFLASNKGLVLSYGNAEFVLGGASFDCGRASDQTWTAISAGDFYVAWDHALMAFDAAAAPIVVGPPPTSRPAFEPRWSVEHVAAFTRWPPLLTADAILTIEVDDKERGSAADTQPAGSQPDAAPRFRLRGFRRADGKEMDITREGPLRTEPLKSFGGLAVRDNALILLDGNRLIGYVGER
jgi:hypothetical protein